MRVELKKFGPILVSRTNGREAFLGFLPVINSLKNDEDLEIDFEGVVALGPSWGDEFLSPLFEQYKDSVKLLNADNASVRATLQILEEIKSKKKQNS